MLPFERNNERGIKREVSKDFTSKERKVVGIPMLLQSFFSFSLFFDMHNDLRTTGVLVASVGNWCMCL